MKTFAVEVESGRKGKDGQPSVGPVYRNVLSKSGFPPPDPRVNTSWDVFSIAVQKYPENRMLGWREFVDGKATHYLWKTYKEIYEEVLLIGSALRACGAQPGTCVGIYGPNCPQWIIAMEACSGHSLICVPLYDTLGPGAVDYVIQHAEINIVFVHDKKAKQLLNSKAASERRLKVMACFSSLTREQKDNASSFGTKLYSWNEFLQIGKENQVELCPPQPLHICTIMYTSGTSGDPKGVILTHENHVMYLRGVDLFMEQFEDKMTTDDVYLSFLPLAHILDRMIEEYFFHKGASVGYYQGDINALMDDLMELKPTLFAGVPRVFEKVHEGILKVVNLNPWRRKIFNLLYKYKLFWMKLGYPQKRASPLADILAFCKIKEKLGGNVRLMISGGAPLSTEIEEFMRVTGCAFFTQGYGLTETCGLSSLGLPDEMNMISTVGPPSVYSEIRLEEVPDMGYSPFADPPCGEICVRGKTVFSGYHKKPELTKEVIRDGWFHTGDIGEMRPDGILKIIDRKKNIFKLSHGEYVAAEHLESIYSCSPVVEDIWVYGDSLRSSLVAVVVPHEDYTMKWAEWNGFVGSFPELCSLEQFKKHILVELQSIAFKKKLRGFERIIGVIVENQPFDVERELITPTMKKRTAQLLKYYQVGINEVYENDRREKLK